jgi:excisionase family DNA binding protein
VNRKLLKLPEVAQILDCTYARTAQLIRRGVLPGVRLGRHLRVSPEALKDFIDSGGRGLPEERPLTRRERANEVCRYASE